MPWSRILGGASWRLLCLTLILTAFPVLAAPSSDSLINVVPPNLKVIPGKTAEVLVMARNPDANTLKDLRLSWLTDTNLKITCDNPKVDSLQGKSSFSWLVRLTSEAQDITEGSVLFRVTYTKTADKSQPAGSESQPAAADSQQVATTDLEIKERPADTIEKMAGLEVSSSLDKLQAKQKGFINLIVTNKSSVPMKISRLEAIKPSLFDLKLTDAESLKAQVQETNKGKAIFSLKDETLKPQETRVLPVEVTIAPKARLVSGKHRCLFTAGLEWDKSGRHDSGALEKHHDIDVGIVPGESKIFELVGVPSFFFLPGALMVIAFLTCLKFIPPKRTITLDAKAPEFYLISITLSLLAAPAYSKITDWFGNPRDYLEGYNLSDIFNVWMGSILAGILATLCWTSAVRGYARWRMRMRYLPTQDDDALPLLQKLAKAQMNYPPEFKEWKISEGKTVPCFIASQPQGDQVWIAPLVIITWDINKPAGNFAHDAFLQELGDAKSFTALVASLKKGIEEGAVVDVAWEEKEEFKRPALVQNKLEPLKKKIDLWREVQ